MAAQIHKKNLKNFSGRLFFLILVLFIGNQIVSPVNAIPVLPADYYGNLTITGRPAPAGTVVNATINGIERGSIITTEVGNYGGIGTFDPRLVVYGNETDINQIISFTINGILAEQNSVFKEGYSTQLNLSVNGLSGTVSYEGAKSGPIIIELYNRSINGTILPINTTRPIANGMYIFPSGALNNQTCWFGAYLDVNDDHVWNPGEEPRGYAINRDSPQSADPVVVSISFNNIDILLKDPPVIPAPVAGFTANITSGTAPLAVQFNDTSTGIPTAWNWSFRNVTGNNTQVWWSTVRNATLTFGAGNFSIVLNAGNSAGYNISTQVMFINVSPAIVAPVANFTATPVSGIAPLTVIFTDLSTNSPTSWNWTFGDGSRVNATEQNPVHTYTKSGTYIVSLNATNAAGSNIFTRTNYITATAAPTVTAISPKKGSVYGKTLVTISGTGFTGATAVRFGTTKNTTPLTVISATRITIKSPAHAAGIVDVKVITPNGTSAASTGDKFTYVPRPTVTNVSPTKGPVSGKTLVTITGTGFTGATSVRFGSTAGTNKTVVSDTKITVRSPAHSVGTVDVRVTTPGGTSTISTDDRFTYARQPAIKAISPKRGRTAGNTLVTITGTRFTGAMAVKFGTAAGTSMTVVSDTSITVRSPRHSAGAVDVRVTTPGGTSAIVTADRFTYVVPPAITGISPASGTRAGNTLVTITGTGFTGATAVKFGTIAGTSRTVVSNTTITIKSPAHAVGTVDVRVKTPGGTSAISTADRFTYT